MSWFPAYIYNIRNTDNHNHPDLQVFSTLVLLICAMAIQSLSLVAVLSIPSYEDTDKLLCCQTADLTADLNLYFVLKGHVPASLFALADHM